jgi:hypothetical protein
MALDLRFRERFAFLERGIAGNVLHLRLDL